MSRNQGQSKAPPPDVAKECPIAIEGPAFQAMQEGTPSHETSFPYSPLLVIRSVRNCLPAQGYSAAEPFAGFWKKSRLSKSTPRVDRGLKRQARSGSYPGPHGPCVMPAALAILKLAI